MDVEGWNAVILIASVWRSDDPVLVEAEDGSDRAIGGE